MELLSDNLRSNCISLAKFKSDLLVYYKNALINVYDPENPRTWKTFYIKCHTDWLLRCGISCSC